MKKILVILGTTRKGRRGESIAKAVMSSLENNKKAEFELVNLRNWNLPFYDFPGYPSTKKGKYESPLQEKWAKKIDSADGFIALTPEYNHGYPAVLKNAFDYLWYEWNHKPIAFISYGGLPAATRAVEQLREVVIEFEMIPVRDTVLIPNVSKVIDEDGKVVDESFEKRVEKLGNKLIVWVENLDDLRKALAY